MKSIQANMTRRWFDNHGFPMYDDCREIFDNKRAAPVDFGCYPDYAHYQTFYVDPKEENDDEQAEERTNGSMEGNRCGSV